MNERPVPKQGLLVCMGPFLSFVYWEERSASTTAGVGSAAGGGNGLLGGRVNSWLVRPSLLSLLLLADLMVVGSLVVECGTLDLLFLACGLA